MIFHLNQYIIDAKMPIFVIMSGKVYIYILVYNKMISTLSTHIFNKAYRPNAHLLYIVMQYNGNVI